MTPITQALLDQTTQAAQASPRRRRNHNFHAHDSYPSNRLLNAVEPDSYVMPHRHIEAAKDETIVALRGRFGVVMFNDDGSVRETVVIAAGGAVLGVDIPHGEYHSLVALESGSVFFKAKAGPYAPLLPQERAPWAPAEGETGAADYLRKMQALFVNV